jgi:hypothetical protein
VRTNAVGSLFQTAADGRLAPDWSQDQLQTPEAKLKLNAKPLIRASFLIGLTGFEPATT